MTVFFGALREAITRRILLAGLVVAVLYLVIFAVGFHYAAQAPDGADSVQGAVIMTILGMYGVQFLSSVMAILLASGAIAGELESDRALIILARPLPRWSWLIQRVMAFGGLAVAYALMSAVGVVVISRIFSGYIPINATLTVALVVLQVMVIVGVCVALSTRASAIASAVVVVALYGLGWLAGIMEFVGQLLENVTLERLGVGFGLLMPTDAVWRGASYYLLSPVLVAAGEQVDIPFASTRPPSVALILWGVIHVVIFTAAAIRWLTRRDL